MAATTYDSNATRGLRHDTYLRQGNEKAGGLHSPEVERILGGQWPEFRKGSGRSQSVYSMGGGDTPLRKKRGGIAMFRHVGLMRRKVR
jgi:hypothetical protein